MLRLNLKYVNTRGPRLQQIKALNSLKPMQLLLCTHMRILFFLQNSSHSFWVIEEPGDAQATKPIDLDRRERERLSLSAFDLDRGLMIQDIWVT